MDITAVYNADFVDQVRSVLDAECVDGKRVTKGALVSLLNLEVSDDPSRRAVLETVVGGVVTLCLSDEYDSQPGIGGGFGKRGAERAKSGPNFPANFIAELQDTCNTHVTGGRNSTREELARHMNIEPTPKNLNFISQAFAGGHIRGYVSKRGKGGISKDATANITKPTAPVSIDHEEVKTGTDG